MKHEAQQRIQDALGDLKDFQRATVTQACMRLDGPNGLHGRLLVGDEVGLGKTLVARGVVASLLSRRLECNRTVQPLRVVYICSNQALAHENAGKLAVFSGKEQKQWVSSLKFGRLAELGLKQDDPEPGTLMESCSLTPATSFSLSRGGGNALERYILWLAVKSARQIDDTEQLEEFFRNGVKGAWEYAAWYCDNRELEPQALAEFIGRLKERPKLNASALTAAKALQMNLHSWATLIQSLSEVAAKDVHAIKHRTHLTTCVRGGIRQMFVEACARNLKADIFILDEFQRFSALLHAGSVPPDAATGEDTLSEEQIIARRVLHEGTGYATLLLSATPFKALTHLDEDQEGHAHEKQLNDLLGYLCRDDKEVLGRYANARDALLRQLLTLPAAPLVPGTLSTAERDRVEDALRPYICRSERGAIEPDIEKIFVTVRAHEQDARPQTAEIDGFVALDRLAQALQSASRGHAVRDVMQFHKAAPWSLSFLSGYQLRETLRVHARETPVKEALQEAGAGWIPYQRFRNYSLDLTREAPNGRFAQVLRAAAPEGAERLLWVPPSLSNYAGCGPFKDKEGFSKTLLFSSLVLAPRALSSYVSYECERRLLARGRKHHDYLDNRDSYKGTLLFDGSKIGPAWGLIYPSARLAAVPVCHPGVSLDGVRQRVRDELTTDFRLLCERYGHGTQRYSARWYALAPFLLDMIRDGDNNTQASVTRWARAFELFSVASQARKAHVSRVREALARADGGLGEPPADLLGWLVDLAIAGPAVCMRRTLGTVWETGATDDSDDKLIAHATDCASSFIDKMNRMESQRVLRAVLPGAKPWVAVSSYAAMGNLQAVFDEFLHLLKSVHRSMDESVGAFHAAIAPGAVSLTAQTALPPLKGQVKRHDVTFHCHYAVPFGNQSSTEEVGIKRITNVRASFNSPFWPFMLNSTSIGQEGLDFHWYCRRVVHWSMPSNPIDLEQREGRINRYKSLVVRQRVAQAYGNELTSSATSHSHDVWTRLFHLASKDERRSDLVPYWYVPRGNACLERIVPVAPFSSEIDRLDEILRILSLYRLSFGQPRQQELIENLLRRNYEDADLREIRDALLVDLAPINRVLKAESLPAGVANTSASVGKTTAPL